MPDALSGPRTHETRVRGSKPRIILTDSIDAKSRAAAVHVKRQAAAFEAGMKLGVLDRLTTQFWTYPGGPAEKDPYQCARVLLGGWDNFRIAFTREFDREMRLNPHVQGRCDPIRFARGCWGRLETLLHQWCANTYGMWHWGPRDVIWLFENHWVGFPKEPKLKDEVWKITEGGQAKGWRTTALERTGTFHELLGDMILTPSELSEQHNIWAEQCKAADGG